MTQVINFSLLTDNRQFLLPAYTSSCPNIFVLILYTPFRPQCIAKNDVIKMVSLSLERSIHFGQSVVVHFFNDDLFILIAVVYLNIRTAGCK